MHELITQGRASELLEVLKHQRPIVTTMRRRTPQKANRAVAKRIDEAARKANVAVLGQASTRFTMDALPIALSAVCERVDRAWLQRVQDARIRRLPFQQKTAPASTRGVPEQSGERERASRGLH